MTKLELLKKIKALADGGCGGERKVAQQKLDELMQKYGITEAELDENKLNIYWFNYNNKIEQRLLIQTIYKILDKPDFNYYTKKTKDKTVPKTLGFKLTQSQCIEIEFLYDFYKRQWEKEEDLFFSAFVQKHCIFGSDIGDRKEITMDEETEARFWGMVNAVSDDTPNQQIEYKGD